jgi:hypothetical protein
MSELDIIFKQIANEIENHVPIEHATVTDILTAEFELTDHGKDQLEALGASYTTNNDGTTTIVWSDVTIPADNQLTYTFEVKAKDDFIGGNNVYTNVETSKIEADGKEYTLPHPMVNVRAEITAKDLDETIFLGDTVPITADTAKALCKKLTDPGYSYAWYKDEACTEPITEQEIAATVPGTDGVTFYLKAGYTSVMPEAEALANTGDHYVGENTDGYAVSAVGKYTIHVVDGAITIQKTIKTSDYNEKQGDPIFTFKVTDGTTSYYKTLRFTASDIENATDTVTLSTTLTGLAKGSYTVEELDTSNYTLQSVEVGSETTFVNAKNGNKVTFTVGEIDKRYGKVTFTNTKKEGTKPKDTDVLKNTLKVGKKITQSKDGDNGTGNDKSSGYQTTTNN